MHRPTRFFVMRENITKLWHDVKARKRYFTLRFYICRAKSVDFLSRSWEYFCRFIRRVTTRTVRACTRGFRTDISENAEEHVVEKRDMDDSRGEPRRLAVIRQANHPRPRYLNSRRYAVTLQLSYCLCAASLITPIGSYRLISPDGEYQTRCRWALHNGQDAHSSFRPQSGISRKHVHCALASGILSRVQCEWRYIGESWLAIAPVQYRADPFRYCTRRVLSRMTQYVSWY